MNESILPWSLEWWHIVGSLVSISLTVLGLAFRGWSNVIREVKEEWGEKLDHFAKKQDKHEQRLEESIRTLHLTHLEIVNRVAKIEGILSINKTGWPLRDHD